MNVARLAAGLALVCSVACTVENPLYTPVGDLAPGISADLAGVDLAGKVQQDAAGVDLSQPGDGCTTRTCSSVGSQSCDNGVPVPDRTCPQASVCADGYCQPPPSSSNDISGRNCDIVGPSETLCLTNNNTTTSCQPFVNGANDTVLWRCAHAVGAGAVGTQCTQGSQCRSGFCGSNGTCFRACAALADCPSNGTMKRTCGEVKIMVEGEIVTAKSCIPSG